MILTTPPTFLRAQAGVAIVTALLLTLLVAVLVSGMAWRQHVSLRRLENAEGSLQMQWIARGAQEWARLILSVDAQSGTVDHLGEIWAQGLPNTPLQENLLDRNSPYSDKVGEINGRITDLQSRFNIHRLSDQGQLDPAMLAVFDRLLQGAGSPPGVAKAFALRYLAAMQGRALTSNLLLVGINPLSAAPELHPYWPQLESQLTWLPRTTQINLNTASVGVLTAALPGFSENQLHQLLAAREQAYFRSTGDALQRLNDSNLTLPANLLSTESDFFLVESDIRYGRLSRRFEWAIERKGRISKVIWQRES